MNDNHSRRECIGIGNRPRWLVLALRAGHWVCSEFVKVDQALVTAAIALAERRYSGDPDGNGWAGAAAMYTSDGQILTSVFVDAPNDAATLCCETGAIAEAHKLNLAVTASVCVSREQPDAPFVILTPCGICQERLAYWGGDVQVAVPNAEDPTRWLSKPLREVQPHYWRSAFERF